MYELFLCCDIVQKYTEKSKCASWNGLSPNFGIEQPAIQNTCMYKLNLSGNI